MLCSCLMVIRWSCLGSCAALRDDFGATAWWSIEHRQVAWVWCTAGLGRRATVNRQGLRLVLMPGRKLLLLSAQLSSGVPRSTRHCGWAVWRCFLADVLDGCFSWFVSDKVLLPTTSAVQTGLLLFWFLPFCLFCHWRVGRVGRRGLLT